MGVMPVKKQRDAEYYDYVRARLPSLYRLALVLTGDRTRADDLVQQTVTSLYVYWRRMRSVTNADAYVRAILVRAHLREHRTAWSRHVTLVPSVPEPAEPGGSDVETRTVLLDALRRLPPRQRAVVVLRYLEDQSVEAVAAILGCSPGTVKSQAARGLDTLRGLIGQPAQSQLIGENNGKP